MNTHPSTVAELDALIPGTVIITGSGFAYQRTRGKWKAHLDVRGSSSEMMLDPDHCRPPLTVIHMPDEQMML